MEHDGLDWMLRLDFALHVHVLESFDVNENY
jgi:hypothetical protein